MSGPSDPRTSEDGCYEGDRVTGKHPPSGGIGSWSFATASIFSRSPGWCLGPAPSPGWASWRASWAARACCSSPIQVWRRPAIRSVPWHRCATPAWRCFVFDGVEENPTTRHVEAGAGFRADASCIDFLIAVGGGSSMDCAKGINFLLTNGGTMADYKGFGKASKPMLPSIGVPTTAGTGSEAQSYALIADEQTHMKMACGDRKAAFRVAILDPEVTVSQPAKVTAVTGIDALSHALESYVTTRRNPLSQMFAREAWRLLEAELGNRPARSGQPRGPRGHAAGCSLRRHRHRKLDARRLPRLRQPADGALRR